MKALVFLLIIAGIVGLVLGLIFIGKAAGRALERRKAAGHLSNTAPVIAAARRVSSTNQLESPQDFALAKMELQMALDTYDHKRSLAQLE